MENNREGLEIKESINVTNFNNHDSPIIYDIDEWASYHSKIVCSREINNNLIECLPFYIDAKYSHSYSTTNIRFVKYSLAKFKFSYKENNCSFTIFKSEYLLCCGGVGVISCDRRDMNFNLINTFNINLPGNTSNLTIEHIDDECIKLIYSYTTKTQIEYMSIIYVFPLVLMDVDIWLHFMKSHSN